MLSPWNLLRRSVVKPASISALASVPAHCSSAVIASTLPLADISRIMLSFCKYRFDARGLDARFIDLKQSKLPATAFDFITAMDVFEHLVDPTGTVDLLHHCLKPGGYIYGRFASEVDPARPEHIVQDFQPVFDRLAELGFIEVFRDEWLWATRCSKKAGTPENQ